MPTSATSLSTGLILAATSFSLGALYSNWAYDFHTLWVSNPSSSAFQASLQHYKTWAEMPRFLYHVHHFILGLGFVGYFVKLYKPSESNKLFDGASLFLYVTSVVLYLTNLRTGVNSAYYGNWGEVDEQMGINVIAASQVMIVFTLLGAIGLQVGQYWAEEETKKLQATELKKKQ